MFRSEAERPDGGRMGLGGRQVSCELIASASHSGAARLSAAAAKVTCALPILAWLWPGSPNIGHVHVPGIGNESTYKTDLFAICRI